MNIIYLAAGSGSRMLPFTKYNPKCLLKIDNDLTIIEKFLNQKNNLKIIDKTFIVTGYKSNKLKKYFSKKIINIHNSNYKSTNMLYSLYLAIKMQTKPFIIIYSDIIFSDYILKQMCYRCIQNKSIYVAVDKQWKKLWKFRYGKINYDLESLKINNSNKITEIGKSVNILNEIDARYMGLITVPKNYINNFKIEIIKFFENENSNISVNNNKKLFITDFLNHLIINKFNIKAEIFNNSWYEFDESNDYLKFINNSLSKSKFNLGV